MLAPRSSPFAPWLRRYFYSGWAFLIPYIFAYLLYYVTRWPVNASRLMENGEGRMQNGWMPCLLHVYWALHAIHAVLAGGALWSWIKEHKSQKPDSKLQNQSTSETPAPELLRSPAPTAANQPTTNYQPSSSLLASRYSLLTALAPWLLLALLFYIPGVYLEWPSDPWQHYARTNEWANLQAVGEHSTWTKSSYFFAYSLTDIIALPALQLRWFDLYYTACCLLLCWQYNRLARTIGLGGRASFSFVLLQVLLFGNFVFGFYRYYGMSSTLFAQLGAVALTRIVLEFAARGTRLDPALQKDTGGTLQCGDGKPHGMRQAAGPEQSAGLAERVPPRHKQESDPFIAKGTKDNPQTQSLRSTTYSLPTAHSQLLTNTPLAHGSASAHHPSRSFSVHRICSLLATRYSLLLCIPCLLLLTAFNHPQGLGIAGFGIAAVIVWRMITWRRSMIWWLGGTALTLSVATVLWFPRSMALDSVYHHTGWLTPWHGFNLFWPQSAPLGPFDRTMAIIGILGIINICLGLILLRRNHVAGWLTVLPPLALSLPLVAMPFSAVILKHNAVEGLASFTRLLLGIPAGLAIVVSVSSVMELFQHQFEERRTNYFSRASSISSYFLLVVAMAAISLIPADRPYYNRLYNVLSVPPKDLSMGHVIEAIGTTTAVNTPTYPGDDSTASQNEFSRYATFLVMPSIGYVLQSTGMACIPWARKELAAVPSLATPMLLDAIGDINPRDVRTLAFEPTKFLYTSQSRAGYLTGHWIPNAVAIAHSAQMELFSTHLRSNHDRCPPQLWLELFSGPNNTHYFGAGAGAALTSTHEDRGDLNLLKNILPPIAKHRVILQPILRTLDGSALRISIIISGHGLERQFHKLNPHPRPLGGDFWLTDAFEVIFPEHGLYNIDIIGDVIWPSQTYKVSYTLIVI